MALEKVVVGFKFRITLICIMVTLVMGVFAYLNLINIVFTNRKIIQSIKYGNKKIELYIFDYGNLASPTIEIGIFSWYDNKYVKGNIFSANWRSSLKININLNVEGETPIIEVFFHHLLAHEVYRKEENINRIKVVYIDVGEGYNFTSYYTGWGKGSFKSIEDSLLFNYREHKNEVGAKNPDQYLQKAKIFSKNLEKAIYKGEVENLPGVERWEKNDKYIDIDRNGDIISFGASF